MDPLARGEIQCQVGDEVYASDDHKLGKVVAFDPRFLTVEHGTLRKGEWFVPLDAVNACNDGRIYLNVPKDAVEGQGWDIPPAVATDADGRTFGS